MYTTSAASRDDMAWLDAYHQFVGAADDEEEDYSSTSSGSLSDVSEEADDDYDDEEMDEEREILVKDRLQESRDFCRDMVPGLDLSEKELAALHCPTEQYQWALRKLCNIYAPRVKERGRFDDSQTPPATAPAPPQQQHKKVFTVSGLGTSILNYMVHNYVNTTKFSNGDDDRSPSVFNLAALAKTLLPYYVEYGCKKFAKVLLRLLGALSHLIYTSLVIVETGGDNQEIARDMLAFTVRLLREECGYPNLRIKARVCQNIVLTGQMNYAISLEKLMTEFIDAVKPHKFTGVIIRLTDLQRWHDNRGDSEPRVLCADYADDDDDTEFIRRINQQVTASAPPSQCDSLDEEELLRALRETDEYESFAPTKVPKGTYLVFKEGSIISTGCNKESQAHVGFTLLYQLLERCKA